MRRSSFRWALLAIGAALLWGAAAPAQAPTTFHGTEAFFDFRKSGHEMLDERAVDLDGDGLLDALVVEQGVEGIGLSVWKAEATGSYRFLWRSEKAPGNVVTAFKPVALGEGAGGFLLDVFEDSPDEADHWVRLFAVQPAGMKPVFESRYQVIHSEEDAGRVPMRVVDLGGLESGLQILPQKQGWPRLVVRTDPKRIVLTGREGQEIAFLIGIHEREYLAEGGRYREDKDRFVDFLPRLVVFEVTATSILPSSEGQWDPAKAADASVDSAWAEGRSGPGTGESVTVVFPRPSQVRMVRVVPGCADSEQSWNQHNRVRSFSVQAEGGVLIKVNRDSPADIDPALSAWSDFALPGRAFGLQTLLFLNAPVKAGWIKVTIDEVEAGSGEENVSCLAEVSVHEARGTPGP